jgi:predicted site-specific integrase-resolvase
LLNNTRVINSTEAEEILGVSRVKIVKMIKAGHLRSVSRSNNDGLKTSYKFLRRDVEQLKKKENHLWQRGTK